MAVEDWDTLPDGTLDLLPMVDVRVAKSPLQVFTRQAYALIPEGEKNPAVRYIQFGMTPAQARQFAQALLTAVERVEQETTGQA